MFVRKTLAALASLAMASAGMLFMASPAHAAVTKQTDCTKVSAVAITEAGPYEFDTGDYSCKDYVIRSDDVVRGDLTFELNVGTWDLGYNDNRAFNISPPTGNNPNNGLRITVASGASGTVVVEFYSAQNSASSLKETYTITIGGGGGGGGGDTPSGDSGSTDALSGLGPHIQEFAMPETGTCDEAQSEGLNWGGVASGGWGESWAQWMNDGAGGDVCTRTLAYNTSTAAWEVE